MSAVQTSPFGVSSSSRMPAANMPPSAKKIVIEIRYSIAMRLWSFVSSHDAMPVRRVEIAVRSLSAVVLRPACRSARLVHSRWPSAVSSPARRRRLQRLDVRDELQQLLFAHHGPGTPA